MAHQVVLQWVASTDTVAGYNVYRGTSAGAESTTALNAAPIVGLTYTDSTVTPGTWFYTVKAIENGVLSPASGEVSTVILPAAPTNLTVVSSS
jgi:hypothetical protein